MGLLYQFRIDFVRTVRQVGQWVIQARSQEHALMQNEATSEVEKACAVSDYESVR
jgi:hypothetical protein